MNIRNLSLLIIAMLMNACARVPYTNRRQFKMLPESVLTGMSLSEYRSFLVSNVTVPADQPGMQLIDRVGDKITTAVEEFLEQRGLAKKLKNFSWEYHLIVNDDANAWCMPGGKVVFYTGILPYTKDEAGAAVVMGHEIAHAIAGHGNERMSQQLALTMGAIGLDIALSQKPQETRDLFLAVFGIGGTVGSLAYSRQHEYEADKLGMVFMAMAGYNPERALTFWQDFASMPGLSTPTFLSTHPSSKDRVEAIKAFMPEALKYYDPDGSKARATAPKLQIP